MIKIKLTDGHVITLIGSEGFASTKLSLEALKSVFPHGLQTPLMSGPPEDFNAKKFISAFPFAELIERTDSQDVGPLEKLGPLEPKKTFKRKGTNFR